MWIIHEPKKFSLWNKRHFEENNREFAACLKYSVLIFVEEIYIKCNIWRVAVRPSYIQDASFLNVNGNSNRSTRWNLSSLLSVRIFEVPATFNILVPIRLQLCDLKLNFSYTFAESTGIYVLKFRKIVVSILWRSGNSVEQVKLGDEELTVFRNGKKSLLVGGEAWGKEAIRETKT
jgi:hypothetical protein